MLAQAYNDEPCIVRLFDKDGNGIADISIKAPLKSEADKGMKALKIRRREKWSDTEWGSEAKVRFVR